MISVMLLGLYILPLSPSKELWARFSWPLPGDPGPPPMLWEASRSWRGKDLMKAPKQGASRASCSRYVRRVDSRPAIFLGFPSCGQGVHGRWVGAWTAGCIGRAMTIQHACTSAQCLNPRPAHTSCPLQDNPLSLILNPPNPLIVKPPNIVPICSRGEVLLLGGLGCLVLGGGDYQFAISALPGPSEGLLRLGLTD